MNYEKMSNNSPKPNQLVWYLDAQLNEVLGYFIGTEKNFPLFLNQSKKYATNHVKYWRESVEEDKLLIEWSPTSEIKNKKMGK